MDSSCRMAEEASDLRRKCLSCSHGRQGTGLVEAARNVCCIYNKWARSSACSKYVGAWYNIILPILTDIILIIPIVYDKRRLELIIRYPHKNMIRNNRSIGNTIPTHELFCLNNAECTKYMCNTRNIV